MELPIDEVIATIREFEGKVDCVQFECTVRSGPAVHKPSGWEIDKPDLPRSASKVLWRPASGQFLIDVDSITATVTEGRTEAERNTFSGMHKVYANDGVAYRSWYRGRLGQEVPAADSPASQVERTGIVCRSDDETRRRQGMALHAYGTGISWVTPYVIPSFGDLQKLSDVLRINKDGNGLVRARLTAAGTWEIHLVFDKTAARSDEFCLQYDPRVGRVIRREAVISSSKEYAWGDWKVRDVADLTYEDDSSVIPKTVVLVQNVHSPPHAFAGEWSYSNQRLNPKVEDDDFRLVFEKGVEVTDYINEKIYVVGSGLEDDRKAVVRFLEMEGLDGSDATGPPLKSVARRNWLLAANGLALAVVLGILIARRYRRKPSGMAMILLAVALAHAEVRAADGWARSRPSLDGESQVQTQQCGHLVTMVALQLRGIDYNLDLFREELKPTKAGVSLAQIKRVLDACGLETDARKNVTVAQIGAVARDGYLAIVPVVVRNGRGHYLVVTKPGSAAQPVVINTLVSVQPLATGLTDKQLAHGGAIALFVGWPQKSAMTAGDEKPALRFEPTEIDLGEIELDGHDRLLPIDITFALHNNSDRPVLVRELAVSCACTTPGWNTAIVDPHSSRDVPISVSRLRWGAGRQQQSLAAKIADGSSVTGRVAGVGVSRSSQPGLQVAPTTLAFDVDDALFTHGSVELPTKSLHVSVAPEQRAKLQLHATAPWLKTSLFDIDDTHVSVAVTVVVDDDLRRQLHDLLDTPRGEVVVSVGPEGKPVSAGATLSRKPLFSFNSKSVVLSASAKNVELTVSRSHRNGPRQYRIGNVASVPPGLEVGVAETETGQPGIVVRRLPETSPRAYLIRAELICDLGRDIIHSTVVVE